MHCFLNSEPLNQPCFLLRCGACLEMELLAIASLNLIPSSGTR